MTKVRIKSVAVRGVRARVWNKAVDYVRRTARRIAGYTMATFLEEAIEAKLNKGREKQNSD